VLYLQPFNHWRQHMNNWICESVASALKYNLGLESYVFFMIELGSARTSLLRRHRLRQLALVGKYYTTLFRHRMW